MSKTIHCGKRKETTCLQVPEHCEWDHKTNKCIYKDVKKTAVKSSVVKNSVVKNSVVKNSVVKQTAVKKSDVEQIVKVSTNDKKVRCGGRKQQTCLQVPTLCSWDNALEKCIQKSSSNDFVKNKTVSPVVKNKTVSPVVKARKMVVRTPSPKSSTATPKSRSAAPSPKSRSATPSPIVVKKQGLKIYTVEGTRPPQALINLKNRHCRYFSTTPLYSHESVLKLSKSHREKWDSTYKSDNLHLGQRKLLLSEIQLLNSYYKKRKTHPTLIYIGAAIGSHLLILARLFPDVKFVLYDGAQFDKRLKHNKNFEINEGTQGFFTTEKCKELAKKYAKESILFVSDIRLTESDFEGGVMRDMDLQKEWVKIMKPEYSLLKFRMPYTLKHGDSIQYLKGDIMYGIWPKPLSGETRLFVKKANIDVVKKYSFKKYEESMFFHNKWTRQYCNSSRLASPYYCPCYDCESERTIIDTYVKNPQSVHYKLVNQVIDLLITLPAPKFWRKPEKLVEINMK
jgi:hypothetical protein